MYHVHVNMSDDSLNDADIILATISIESVGTMLYV